MLTSELLEDLILEQGERPIPILMIERKIKDTPPKDISDKEVVPIKDEKYSTLDDTIQEILDGVKDGSILYDG